MKIIFKLIIFVFLFSNTIISQSTNYYVKVKYDYTLQLLGPHSKYSAKSILTLNKNQSIFEIDHTKSLDNEDTAFYGEDKTIYKVKSKSNDFVYKDSNKKNIFYSNLIGLKRFYIKDSLGNMNWILNSNKKEILGYNCQEATASYGGRDYIAYFTTEISISNGPWRFDGLPGLILEIYDVEKVFIIKATDLVIKKNKIALKNPYKDEKLLSWDEFLKLYKKKYDEVLRNGMTEYGATSVLAKKSIVEYIKE